jgi:two-component system, OmpR family, response regulator CssR
MNSVVNNMKQSIYLVEDEAKLNHLLKLYLEREGYEVTSFLNGTDALGKVNDHPDLWILDIMLPDTDGFTIFNKIKLVNKEVPIMFMSARDSDIDRLMGLQLGSDDYLAKPFLPQELVIRCNNVMKRNLTRQEMNEEKIHYESYLIDKDKRFVLFNDEEINLTTKEFDLLSLLLDNMQKSLTRDQILNSVWGLDYFGNDRVVDDLVRRLKKKLPLLKLESIYGYGYRLK